MNNLAKLTVKLRAIKAYLAGKKSYIIGVAMFLLAFEKYLTGETTISQFLTTVQGLIGINGLAVLSLRAAIAKTTK